MSCRSAAAAVPERWLEGLESVIFRCVKRDDNPGYAAFHGCWDWHSAVHAHWALFRIALERGADSDATRWAEQSLTAAHIAGEKARLAATESFENPYGRSWLLRLAIDFERWAVRTHVATPDRLRELASFAADSLLAHYRKVVPDPGSREYQNASWALLQLHHWFTFIDDTAHLRAVQKIIEDEFLGQRPAITFAKDSSDFFCRYAAWAQLVAETQSPERFEAFLAANPIDTMALAVPQVTTAHSYGLVWSRAWAIRSLRNHILEPRLRDRLTEAYREHVRRGIENHQKAKDDYHKYGHWVSQFAVYALTKERLE